MTKLKNIRTLIAERNKEYLLEKALSDSKSSIYISDTENEGKTRLALFVNSIPVFFIENTTSIDKGIITLEIAIKRLIEMRTDYIRHYTNQNK